MSEEKKCYNEACGGYDPVEPNNCVCVQDCESCPDFKDAMDKVAELNESPVPKNGR